jgi:hypothetical protein
LTAWDVTHSKAKHVACVGECLIEFNGIPFSTSIRQTFGGDSLNTALYLARLAGEAIDVKYLTVLGTDALSEGMLRSWEAEGIDTSTVLRDPSRLPGLYWIQVGERGERSFLYWRGESAARYLIRHRDFTSVAADQSCHPAKRRPGDTAESVGATCGPREGNRCRPQLQTCLMGLGRCCSHGPGETNTLRLPTICHV